MPATAPAGYVTRRCGAKNGRVYLPCNICSAPLSVDAAGVMGEGEGDRPLCRGSFHMVQVLAERGPAGVAGPAAPVTDAHPRGEGGIVTSREPTPPGDYHAFLRSKAQVGTACGFAPIFLPDCLMDFQKHLVKWNVRRGRAGVLAGTGLGKTVMQLVTGHNTVRHTNRPYLLVTPLAVAAQTVREADKFGVPAVRSRDGVIPPAATVVVTHYDALPKFDPSRFCGVGFDESGGLKDEASKRTADATEFARTLPYRHLYSATPAPNDYVELGTSAEILGEMGFHDMVTRFFKKETKADYLGWGRTKYRLRGHAERDYWRWVCSWARAVRRPSDLGFDDARFELPPLTQTEHVVAASTPQPGRLFSVPAFTLEEQREERKRTLPERCERAAELVAHGRPAVVWCHLNDEAGRLVRLIPGSRQVSGRMSDDEKEEVFEAFASGQLRVLVTKPVIGAWGLNWQHCAHVVTFATHSYEQHFQAVRRCWRFGQTAPVQVDVVVSEGEGRVLDNLRRKADAAEVMFARLVELMNETLNLKRTAYGSERMEAPPWL